MKRLALSLLFVAACGDNAIAPTPESPDAAIPGTPDAMPGATAVIVAGDFASTGVLSTIKMPSLAVTPNAVAGVAGGDPFVRQYGDELFIINRSTGDNITILGHDLALVQQVGTGAGVNPQDVAVDGRTLYVPGLGTAGVVVIDRDHPDQRATIDLGALDPDGHPDCVSAFVAGPKLLVACGVLDENFVARGPTKIAIVDRATKTMTGSFELATANPIGFLVATPTTSMFGGDLLIATAPSFTDYTTGCLARISLGATPAAHGCAVTNAALDGLANHLEVSPDGASLWIAVTHYDDTFQLTGALRAVNLATAALGDSITPAAQIVTDVAACPDGSTVIVDNTFGHAGVRVYKNGAELTTAALDIGTTPNYGNNLTCF
ncbi:MAG: hypothetical protein K8W52_43545 [Deltaproteobacteria bacterium]|nr:hypothetical protein [Deltaproteobacteria bacterium]